MIHKFKNLGQYIVLDVASGAIHSLDEKAYNLLDCFDENGKFNPGQAEEKGYVGEEYAEARRELEELICEKLLFTKDIYEEIAKHWDKQSVVKALCLHIAHDCNLRCKYCFADGGEYMGKRELMSAEVGKKAIDFVIKQSQNRKNIEIDFFGGEPLMNFDVVKEITEYAKGQGKLHDKTFRFTITTNGILLDDEKQAYINENMSNVVLSLDGRKEVHDSVRKRVDGSGSYDRIVPRFQKLADSRNQNNYYVRGTFTRNNLDFAEDVRHLMNLGFEQISVEPVVADEKEDYAIRESDLPRIFDEYDRLAQELVEARKSGKFVNFFHFMIDLEQGPCAYKRLSGCGSGHEYLAVTPSGDLYPCHQFVGKPEFKMGTVFEGTLNQDIRNMFMKSNIYTKEECKKCWNRFYCSGGCAANAFNMNGDINKPYSIACEMQKKRTECAIAMAACLAEGEE
ncbi:MAG: thioether cross-link-forming SCIFF peptide maturase [Clostridia bacterium]